MDDGFILITPSGISKGRLSTDDLIVVDLDGNVISAKADASHLLKLQCILRVYKQREDVRAVVHAHPILQPRLPFQAWNFLRCSPEDAYVGECPITAYATPSRTKMQL
jgi:L-fuculose-phosphate aldolase